MSLVNKTHYHVKKIKEILQFKKYILIVKQIKMGVIHIDSKTASPAKKYNTERNRSGLVVVQFSAEWCGPCKKIAPIFEGLSKEYSKARFVHVDVDVEELSDHPDLESIKGVPTFAFFVDGDEVKRFSGASDTQLKSLVKQYYA